MTSHSGIRENRETPAQRIHQEDSRRCTGEPCRGARFSASPAIMNIRDPKGNVSTWEERFLEGTRDVERDARRRASGPCSSLASAPPSRCTPTCTQKPIRVSLTRIYGSCRVRVGRVTSVLNSSGTRANRSRFLHQTPVSPTLKIQRNPTFVDAASSGTGLCRNMKPPDTPPGARSQSLSRTNHALASVSRSALPRALKSARPKKEKMRRKKNEKEKMEMKK